MKCDYQAMADSSIWCKAHDREWSECLSAEIVSLKETNTRLNRRCQEAERAANVKVEEIRKQGGSLGRALATWSAGDLRRRLEETELQVSDLKKLVEKLCWASPTDCRLPDCGACTMPPDPVAERTKEDVRLCGIEVSDDGLVCGKSLPCSLHGVRERPKQEPECDCFIPALEGAGNHSPSCAIFKGSEKAKQEGA